MIYKETHTIELKKSLAQLDEALKSVCSFLNHKGGTVYFGVDDKGKIIGLQVSSNTLRKISQQIHSRIKPEIVPEITEIKEQGKSIIEVNVPEGNNKPYFLNGKAYKRVGSEDRVIPPDELKKIILEQRQTKWDEEICEEATLKDIDKNTVNMFKEEYERINKTKIKGSDKELLKSLKCIKEVNRKIKITNAGILLFAKKPEDFFSLAYITIARYPGITIGKSYLDIKDFRGNLFDIIDSANDYIREHVQEASELVQGELARKIIPQYPYFAIRELITNAVAHRDYSVTGSRIIIRMFKDRIEFNSPGELPANITPKNILREQFSRNPIIAEVFSKIKFIEKLGEGWNRIIAEVKEHPLKPKLPKVEDTGNTVIITLYSPEEILEKVEPIMSRFEPIMGLLNDRQKKALAYILKHKKIRRETYVEICECSEATAKRDLQFLVLKGIIEQKGAGRAAHYVLQ